jgi:uncharacterized protein YbaR (Trm112 family)
MQKRNRRLLIRACPRCKGDLICDIYDEEFACLQCGRNFTAAQVPGLLSLPLQAAARTEQLAA